MFLAATVPDFSRSQKRSIRTRKYIKDLLRMDQGSKSLLRCAIGIAAACVCATPISAGCIPGAKFDDQTGQLCASTTADPPTEVRGKRELASTGEEGRQEAGSGGNSHPFVNGALQ